MEINGIPLHPLVIHAAVVFTPLAALAAIAYAVPAWRGALRWPLLALTLVAMVSVQVSVMSGEELLESRGLESPLIETHEERAELLRNVMIGFTLVVLAAVALLPRRRRGESGAGGTSSAAVAVPVTLLLVVGAVAVSVLVVLTGDAGAQSVWG